MAEPTNTVREFAPIEEIEEEGAGAMRRARVIIAEDDPEMRRVLASALRRDGFAVIEVEDGKAFVQLLLDSVDAGGFLGNADLVISDIRMPGASGLQILSGVRSLDTATPVILITAFGDEETHEAARALGALAVLDKPFDVDELRALVRKALV